MAAPTTSIEGLLDKPEFDLSPSTQMESPELFRKVLLRRRFSLPMIRRARII